MVSPVPETKHIACARCRDRKVKCDGGKPGCKRCHRNGTPCRYVQGKKQQTRSEWLQHLRTFSSQPGRTHVTRTMTRPSYQPALPQTPRLPPPHLQGGVSYTRSPSPYLFEHIAVAEEENQGALPGGSPFSQTSTESCSGSATWVPTSVEYGYGFTNPNPYLFQPSASFCGTDFTSDALTTASHQAQPGLYPASMRLSEATCPYDGRSESTFPYDAASYNVPGCQDTVGWRPTKTHRGQAESYPSPYGSSY